MKSKLKLIISASFAGLLLFALTSCKTTRSAAQKPDSKASTDASSVKSSGQDDGLVGFYKEQLQRKDLTPDIKIYYEGRLKEVQGK